MSEWLKKNETGRTKSERSIEDVESGMGMGCTRVLERVKAAVGGLDEAPSRFEEVVDVPNGGVLWALPSLLANGLLLHTEALFTLSRGFYGPIHIFLLLAFMTLARIKTPEQLRYAPPGEWGKLLGLDRIPEVRTLREKVKNLAQADQVREWGERLSREWMEGDPEAAGVLYVDGHVRVYHGSQTKLPRRYVSRERLCLRGTTDYWVNDQVGLPFFVINTPFTQGLLEMLRNDIVPRLLREVPGQPMPSELEANPLLARFTIVFDREGYSPEFIHDMWREHRIACVTYHKFPKEEWSESEFRNYRVAMPSGDVVNMKLAERGTYLGKKIWLREIRKLTESGHQTSILSTDYVSDLSVTGAHMFSRWSQENFFKYMLQHFELDRLISYRTETVSDTKKVVNPVYRRLVSQIRSKAGQLGRKLREFGELSLDEETGCENIARFERKKGELKEEIEFMRKDLVDLKKERQETPGHLSWEDLPEPERFKQLSPAKKQFMDTIKMIAYRAETAMAIILRENLARFDDARALSREIFTTEADLVPDEQEETLTIRLHHLTNRISDEAARHLADQLNATEARYPGTNLRLIFKLVSD